MVLNYYGFYVQQKEVVQRVFGVSSDAAANLQRIPYVLNNNQLIADLANKWPIIVRIPGNPISHACGLTAVR